MKTCSPDAFPNRNSVEVVCSSLKAPEERVGGVLMILVEVLGKGCVCIYIWYTHCVASCSIGVLLWPWGWEVGSRGGERWWEGSRVRERLNQCCRLSMLSLPDLQEAWLTTAARRRNRRRRARLHDGYSRMVTSMAVCFPLPLIRVTRLSRCCYAGSENARTT